MDTTTRARNSPPAPPPKPKNKTQNGSEQHQLSYNEHNSSPTFNRYNNNNNNNIDNYHHQNNIKNNNYYTTVPPSDEQVVMTPKGKTSNSTVILIERKLVEKVDDRVHVAGGDHQGIIINKDIVKDQKSAKVAPHLTLEFRVFLVSAKTDQHTQESRTIRFWFREWLKDGELKAQVAQDFFRELVSPKEFPRDYVGFIKKIMKLMQKGYNEIQSVEIELRILEQTSAPPSRPPRPGHLIYCFGDFDSKYCRGLSGSAVSIENDEFEIIPLTPEKVLELIEQAYPNPVAVDDLARDYGWPEDEVYRILLSLQQRGLIKSMEFNSFTRIHHEDKEIKVVKQMPTIASNKQPTIAIITAQYCEKIAVDSMLENKETFVRYTTVGESNVYTLGNIGAHRIVSTKLPSVGSSREASIAAGNTCTRLLGTFQKVDYVFIVGVAGGIPHYTDYKKHVRLGDVVVSSIPTDHSFKSTEKPYCYVYSNDEELKTYYPVNSCLQDIAKSLQAQINGKPWESYFEEGLGHLKEKIETDFSRPSANTDKLYMNIGNRDVIEVQHPLPQDTTDASEVPTMRLHLGPVGSGNDLIKSDTLRTEFSKKYGLLATDVELNSVLDSIVGNCRDSFLLVKGISDYKDGTTTKKWQNYASLSAAAVTKAIICAMDAPKNV